MSFLVIEIIHCVVYRWFDSGRDDGLIERELNVVHYVQSPPPPPEEEATEEDERGYFALCCSSCCKYTTMINIRQGCIV